MKDLIRLAASYGLRLHAAHLSEGVMGLYSPKDARIYFDLGLTPTEVRSVVAHELGHAYYGHTCDEGPASLQERQADHFGAQLLVDPAEYAMLERVSADAHYIAEEMGVTPEVIFDFRRYCLKQFGSRTYAGHSRIS